MTNPPGEKFYEFGKFRLDAERCVLFEGDNTVVDATPKALKILCVLVESDGRVVSKEEIISRVWADSFVEEGNITFTIGLLRKLLGDDTKNPRFIETVPKRGYRFIADARCVEAKDEKFGVADEQSMLLSNDKLNSPAIFSHPISQRRTQDSGVVVALADWQHEVSESESRESDTEKSNSKTTRLESASPKPNSESKLEPKYHIRLVAFALSAFLIGASALGYYFYGSKKASSADGKKSIAVLPLKPINSANRDEIYEIGIADSLILKLSSMKGFIV